MPRFAVGVEFGERAARVAIVREDGDEAAAVEVVYPRGVLDRELPDHTPLGRDWSLQDPRDYLRVLGEGLPKALAEAAARPADVAGVGVAFAASTLVPALADGTPLCVLPRFAGEPHAWVKTARHRAPDRQALRVSAALDPAEYPGVTGDSRWFLPKAAQIAEEAPAVFQAAERLVEAGDWVVWQLTGGETRSQSLAGFRSFWRDGRALPAADLCPASKRGGRYLPAGAFAGQVTGPMAGMTGLRPGLPVAAATLTPHAAVAGCGVAEPGTMTMAFDGALHPLVLGAGPKRVAGCTAVENGLVPGCWAYEARPLEAHDRSAWLSESPAAMRPGQCGLLVVDRDGRLIIAGLTPETKPAAIARALVESRAFAVRNLIDAFEREAISAGHPIACGDAGPELLQAIADATGREVRRPKTTHACALGAAIHGAVAGGLYADLAEASRRMGSPAAVVYRPDPSLREAFDRLYDLYLGMRSYFTGGGAEVLDRLTRLRGEV